MQTVPEVLLDPEKSYEIVNGQPEEKETPGARHGGIGGRLSRRLGMFVETQGLGEIYVETSFQIGENERIPDLAFVTIKRLPPEGEPETKWLMPPDLAVEIVSPENRTITIYRSATNIIAFPEDSELVSEDLFPGFRCHLSEIFKNPALIEKK